MRRRTGSRKTGTREACRLAFALMLAAAAWARSEAHAAQAAHSAAEAGTSRCALREMDDPRTGGRWLLVRDATHPGGPGRMVLTGPQPAAGQGPAKQSGVSIQPAPIMPGSGSILAPLPLVVHGGDALAVEERTAVVYVRLEAVAMEPAAEGSSLWARLKVGGKVVQVIALGAGRARLAPASGLWP